MKRLIGTGRLRMTRFNNNFLRNAKWQEPEPMRPRNMSRIGGVVLVLTAVIAIASAVCHGAMAIKALLGF